MCNLLFHLLKKKIENVSLEIELFSKHTHYSKQLSIMIGTLLFVTFSEIQVGYINTIQLHFKV